MICHSDTKKSLENLFSKTLDIVYCCNENSLFSFKEHIAKILYQSLDFPPVILKASSTLCSHGTNWSWRLYISCKPKKCIFPSKTRLISTGFTLWTSPISQFLKFCKNLRPVICCWFAPNICQTVFQSDQVALQKKCKSNPKVAQT